MSNGIYQVPVAINEPVLNYAPGSPERASIKAALKKNAQRSSRYSNVH